MDRTPGIRPHPSLGRRLDAASRAAFPATGTALALILLAAPLDLPAQAELQPAIVLVSIFFWSLFRPASLPPPVVLALGLLADLLGDSPLGVGVLTLLIVHGLALRWRRGLVRQGFLLVWLAFAGVAAGAASLSWALTSVLCLTLLPSRPAVFEALLAIGIYPALAVLLIRAHRSLAAPEFA